MYVMDDEKEDMILVSSSQPFIKPISDECYVSLQCLYEETMGISGNERWWELSVGDTLFYLTKEALAPSVYTEGEGWELFSVEVGESSLEYMAQNSNEKRGKCSFLVPVSN